VLATLISAKARKKAADSGWGVEPALGTWEADLGQSGQGLTRTINENTRVCSSMS
jgi:hypothetical protein